MAYLLGERGFRRLVLRSDRRALVPRPETEALVEIALAALPPGGSLLDLGTGSGNVALAVVDERADAQVVAVDLSDDALALAAANVEALAPGRVRLLRSDLYEPSTAPVSTSWRRTSRTSPSAIRAWRPTSRRTSRRSRCTAAATGSTCCAGRSPGRPTTCWPAAPGPGDRPGQAAAVRDLLTAAGFGDLPRRATSPASSASSRGGCRARHDAQADPRRGPPAARRRLPRRPSDDRADGHGLRHRDRRARARGLRAALAPEGPRPAQPMALVCGSVESIFATVLPELEGRAAARARRLLPGPVTLIVPNPARRYRWLAGSTPDHIGLRVPDLDPRLAAAIDEVGAIAATSANPTGHPAPRRLSEVDAALLDRTAVALDGGEVGGLASTVIDLTGASR